MNCRHELARRSQFVGGQRPLFRRPNEREAQHWRDRFPRLLQVGGAEFIDLMPFRIGKPIVAN